MKSPARLGWRSAILLAFSLITPFTAPASAAQADVSPTATPFQSVTPSDSPAPSQSPTDEATDNDADVPAESVQPPVEVDEQPVEAAALGDLKLFSKNTEIEDVPGASYTIFDSACTTVLAGPTAADEFGSVTFTGVAEQGTQVCVVISNTPPGFLVPDPLVISLSTDALLTQCPAVHPDSKPLRG